MNTDASQVWSLIVDNDPEHSRSLSELLTKRELNPASVSTLAAARVLLDSTGDGLAAAFVALDLSDGEGLDLLDHPALKNPDIALMHTKDDPIRALRGIKRTASYFFCKPFDDVFVGEWIDDIKQDFTSEILADAEGQLCTVDQFGMLRGSSKPMRKLYRVIRKVAPTTASVLLIGESGTGKELAAQTLHELSELKGPFIAVNCGAISPELAESELFGHMKGSFSGAEKQHAGFFERAEGGTLLLDEIGEMSLDLQVKLLRVLESRKYRRVGGEKTLTMNVRIIAATNRDPEEAIQSGLLREDLYFRIAQFSLKLPALRDRGADIIGLAQLFLNEFNEADGSNKVFSDDARLGIANYPWPGNVRELRSAVERAYIMAGEQLKSNHFPDEQVGLDMSDDFLRVTVGETLEDSEKKLIMATLEANSGDKKIAAEQLGISLKTLYNRLNEYRSEPT